MTTTGFHGLELLVSIVRNMKQLFVVVRGSDSVEPLRVTLRGRAPAQGGGGSSGQLSAGGSVPDHALKPSMDSADRRPPPEVFVLARMLCQDQGGSRIFDDNTDFGLLASVESYCRSLKMRPPTCHYAAMRS